MTFLVPFDVLDRILVALPDLLRNFRHVDGPEVNLIVTCSSQLPVILPNDVEDLAGLNKCVLSIFIDSIWVPNLNICVLSARCNQAVVFVPC